ncbi:MAG: efflux RND transporter periplasmic adaptor subunit, partial [Desulfuromonadales bacterium]
MADEDLGRLKIDKKPAGGRSPRRRYLWTLLLLTPLVLLLLWRAGVLTPAIAVQLVTVSRIHPSQSLTLLNASGYVVAQRKAAVASEITGRLVWLGVEEGSAVQKGEVIARLESRQAEAAEAQAAANLATARARVTEARAEWKEAKQDFERMSELLAAGFVSPAEFDRAEARYRRAEAGERAAETAVTATEAALRQATVGLDYTRLRAPFDAVVLTKNADIGDIVTPLGAAAEAKAAVVNIADLDSLQVEADVSESNLSAIKVGQPVEIQLDALPDERFAGEVHMIVPTADRTKATVLVKVRFLEKDPRILPEMSARVAFLRRPLKEAEMQPRTA